MKIILKKGIETLTYRKHSLLLEQTLLRGYNERHIKYEILNQIDEINALYHENMGVVSSDGDSLVNMSTPVDKLVQRIEDRKQRLEQYRQDSIKKLTTLNKVVQQFNPSDQRVIKDYFRKGYEQPNNTVVKKLRRVLYLIEQRKRNTKIAMFEMQNESTVKDEVKELKQKLQGVAL